MVYVLQIYDSLGAGWTTVTKPMKQPLEWSLVDEFWVDLSMLTTDFVEFDIVTKLDANVNRIFMEYHEVNCKLLITEEIYDPITQMLEYEHDINLWQQQQTFYVAEMGTSHEETFNLAQHHFTYPYHLWAHNWSDETCKFMTDMPLVMEECLDDNKVLSFNSHLKGMYLTIIITRESGATSIPIRASADLMGIGVYQIGVGFPQLKAYFTAQGTLATWWTATNGWSKIQYMMADSTTNTIRTARYTSNFSVCGCNDEHVRLWWRNNRNGVDAFTFKGANAQYLASKFEIYQKPLGFRRHQAEDPLDSDYTDKQNNSFNQKSSGQNKVNIEAHKEMKVISSWENKEKMKWIADLLISNQVYVELRDGSHFTWFDDPTRFADFHLTPVIVKNTRMKTKPLNNTFSKIELDLRYANPKTVIK